jgi:DedD protein
MMDADDVQLQIKKKARRRLVGAVAFFALAALVLPVVMDQEPTPSTQEVEIRIPGQDDAAFQPSVAPSPPDIAPPPVAPSASAPVAATPASRTTPASQQNVAQVIQKVPSGSEARPNARPEARPEVRAETRPPANATAPATTPPADPAATLEAQRAAAILAGRFDSTPTPATAPAAVPHVILIGAFINDSNVQNLKTKLGELGIKVYTEPLASPQGMKTRVRAGPFPNRDAAERALEKMKSIGVDGVVAAQ